MAQKLYRIVTVSWESKGRVERPIDDNWMPLAKAEQARKSLAQKHPSTLYALQPESRKT